MASRKIQISLLLLLAFTLGCQPARDDKSKIARGRLARGTVGSNMSAPRSGTTGAGVNDPGYNKLWGEVTSQAGDQAFDQELYLMDYAALSTLSPDDQLGYVSSQSGQTTGVRFWGNAQTANGSGVGAFDRNSMILRLEIYDSHTGEVRSDGSVRSNIPIQISADQPTFVDAGGTVQNGQVYMYFTDLYGSIYISGTMNGQTFSGVIGYASSGTGNQSRQLGQFSVATCGFFQCN